MRFTRSWVFWTGIPLTLLLLIAGFAAADIIVLAALKSVGHFPLYMPIIIAIIGLSFFLAPCYALWTLLNKSVEYVDIDSKITVKYITGKKVSLNSVQMMELRPSYQTLTTLVILDRGGQMEINAPFEFKDHRGLFAALEKACGMKIIS